MTNTIFNNLHKGTIIQFLNWSIVIDNVMSKIKINSRYYGGESEDNIKEIPTIKTKRIESKSLAMIINSYHVEDRQTYIDVTDENGLVSPKHIQAIHPEWNFACADILTFDDHKIWTLTLEESYYPPYKIVSTL